MILKGGSSGSQNLPVHAGAAEPYRKTLKEIIDHPENFSWPHDDPYASKEKRREWIQGVVPLTTLAKCKDTFEVRNITGQQSNTCECIEAIITHFEENP